MNDEEQDKQAKKILIESVVVLTISIFALVFLFCYAFLEAGGVL